MPPTQPLAPPEIRRRLEFTDEQLRAECVVHTHRTGGPGGQHRNKTESAVRLEHRPTGVIVTGQERRSQHQNAANALTRLREALAIQFRTALPESPTWPATVQVRDQRLRVAESNAGFFHVLALALDALDAYRGNPKHAADYLGVTTSSLTRFLADHPKAWTAANEIRRQNGLTPLKP